MRRQTSKRGFTLLELLVSITLLSLIGFIMLGGLRAGTRVWEQTAASTDAAETIGAAQRLLRRQLTNAYPLWREVGPSQSGIAFDGTSATIAFVGPPPPQLGPAPNQQFRLDLSSGGELELAWQSADDAAAPRPVQSTLLVHIASVEFTYFGPDTTGRNPRWWDGWSGRRQLPELIRIRVRFPPGDRRVWPELVVHPEIMVDVACVYDPIYRGCRGR